MMLAIMAAASVIAGAEEVSKLTWLAGSWTHTANGVSVRETWLAPLDGVMGGVGQTNRPGKGPLVEFMKISAEPAGVTFTAIVPGQPPTAFVRVPGKDGEVVFENKDHDFPQRVIYRRCDADLCARIEGTISGKMQFQDWRYTRMK